MPFCSRRRESVRLARLLPPAIRPKSKAELLAAEQPDTDYEPADDFDDFDEDSGAETADPGA